MYQPLFVVGFMVALLHRFMQFSLILFFAFFGLMIEAYASSDCGRYGPSFKGLLETETCFDIKGQIRFEVVINDPDNPQAIIENTEFNSRLRTDIKLLRESRIGTLSSFIRLQADYDPDIFDDLLTGKTGDDFAVGLDAFEISLHRGNSAFHIGKIENAGATFISNGFTDRGAESLDARSGLGIAYQSNIAGTDIRISLNNPRDSTEAMPVSPNAGFGLSRKIGPFSIGAGAALVNVDRLITPLPVPQAVRSGSPLNIAREAGYGFGAGFDIKYEREGLKTFTGITYTDNAANDVIFSFSDGFDAITFYAGISKTITEKLIFNADFSYVSAVEKGLRDLNGVEAAANLAWRLYPQWQLLGEVGFDNVDDFGAGDGFFFIDQGREELDFLLQIKHDF